MKFTAQRYRVKKSMDGPGWDIIDGQYNLFFAHWPVRSEARKHARTLNEGEAIDNKHEQETAHG